MMPTEDYSKHFQLLFHTRSISSLFPIILPAATVSPAPSVCVFCGLWVCVFVREQSSTAHCTTKPSHTYQVSVATGNP